jgi:N-carbamoylputrescine amidase
MREVTVAAVQTTCTWDREQNVERTCAAVREAARRGAQIVCLQELFETPYFCADQPSPDYFDLARGRRDNPTITTMAALAAELGVVLPVTFFERAGQVFFNTAAIIDADGSVLGYYRKSHIPDDPGYSEKYYFSPGDTGFRVWHTKHAVIGVGICWDQWFPECARAMALMGAELLLYPTAIGDEPTPESADTRDHWQTVIRGHAAANLMPVIVANRVGTEEVGSGTQTYYGSSFITDEQGALVAAAERVQETVVTATFDLDRCAWRRVETPLFRDRRVDLYAPLLSLDGGENTRMETTNAPRRRDEHP